MKKNKNMNLNQCKYIIRSIIIILIISFFVYHILKKPVNEKDVPNKPETTIVETIGLSYIVSEYDLEFNSERFEKDLTTLGFSKALFAIDDNKISYYRKIDGSAYTEYINWNIISESTSNINSIALYYYISDTTVLHSEKQVNLEEIENKKEIKSSNNKKDNTITDTKAEIKEEVNDALNEDSDVDTANIEESNVNITLNIANTVYDSDNNKLRETFIVRESNQLENTNTDNATLILQNNLTNSSYISILDSISNLKPLDIENSMHLTSDAAIKKYSLFIDYYSKFLKQIDEVEGKENQIENTSLQKTTITENDNANDNSENDNSPVNVTIEDDVTTDSKEQK